MALNNNIASFERLELSHRDKVTSYTKGLAKDELDYEDIYQQAIIKAWKSFEKFKGNSKFSTWLCSICRNVAIDEYRKKNRKKTLSYDMLLSEGLMKEPTANTNPFIELANKEMGDSIQAALSKLRPNHKEILNMHLYKGMSYKDISTKLGIPKGTVMSRIYLAKKNARRILK